MEWFREQKLYRAFPFYTLHTGQSTHLGKRMANGAEFMQIELIHYYHHCRWRRHPRRLGDNNNNNKCLDRGRRIRKGWDGIA